MKHDITVTIGRDGLASSIAVTSSGMICDIYTNTYAHITASVVTPQTFFELTLHRMPQDDGLYWVKADPFALEAPVSFGPFGFPVALFTHSIPDMHTLTMIVESIVLLSSVMGVPREQMSNLFDVVTE